MAGIQSRSVTWHATEGSRGAVTAANYNDGDHWVQVDSNEQVSVTAEAVGGAGEGAIEFTLDGTVWIEAAPSAPSPIHNSNYGPISGVRFRPDAGDFNVTIVKRATY